MSQPQSFSISCCQLPKNPLGSPERTRSSRLLTAIVAVGWMFMSTLAFSTSSSSTDRAATTTHLLYASRAATPPGKNVVQPAQPRSSISAEEREQAIQAMDRKRAEESLTGVDAQMLELLSDQFLYPTQPPKKQRERPRGRPDCVPGAMNYDTLVKFRERVEAMEMVNGDELSTIKPYTSAKSNALEQGNKSVEATESTKANGRTTKRIKRVKGVQKAEPETETKKRKKVVKNLPEPKKRTGASSESKSKTTPFKWSGDQNLDLQKYYRTELLTPEEEYSLGMKVQLMMKCEEVHEGLCIELLRVPTMEEWARACGFTEHDPMFVETEGDAQIRPTGAESMFEESDPNMFVGNGLATDAGPGRGRGRVKKPPPTQLGDYHDDSEERFVNGKRRSTEAAPSKKKSGKIINRGTPTDFVEIMLDAKDAKQQMVQSNMRLVVSIARKYSNVGVNLQDLVQEGSLGLTRAAEKFKPKKGFKFSTYASWWIQQAVFRSIAYHSRTIRLPVHVHNLLNRVRRVRTTLEQELGRAPTNEEMAKQLDMTTEKYNKMMRLTRRSISLELPKYQSNPKDLGHESEDLLGDTISATSVIQDESSPEKRVDRGLFREDLREMLQILEEDERRVICARYGLTDGLTRTVTTVAAQMKQTKAWVRSQECRALRKLRRPWYEKRLKEHQDSLTS